MWPGGRRVQATYIGLKVWDLPKIPARGRPRFGSLEPGNIFGLPYDKSTVQNYSLNFMETVVWPGGRVQNLDLPSSAEGKRKLLVNNQTSRSRLGSAALVHNQPRRRTTPIRNPRVPRVLDRLDVWRTWSMNMSEYQKPCPAVGQWTVGGPRLLFARVGRHIRVV